jgi:F-type H+-transporting ATPase subunit b
MELITPSLGLVFWTTVVFLIFWTLVGKFAFKPISESLKNRENSIKDALASAEKARNEMQSLQADNEKLLQQAREERAAILKEAKDMKESIISEAQSRAKKDAETIVLEARQEIEAQKNAALDQVRSDVSKIAIEIAEKVLRKELSSDKDHKQYIDGMVDNIKLN